LISNNRNAEALARAKSSGLPAYVLNAATHPEPDALDKAILETLQKHGCELILLAGYMKKIGPRVLRAFPDCILNIHPALLPKHGGRGMFGMNVHRAVLAAGDDVTGVSVHLVDEEYDRGRVLCQTEVAVLPGDTPESLAARVLAREHEFLVETLDGISNGKLAIGAGKAASLERTEWKNGDRT
jgi:phosphoribosylglycinamide formyltransferase 1